MLVRDDGARSRNHSQTTLQPLVGEMRRPAGRVIESRAVKAARAAVLTSKPSSDAEESDAPPEGNREHTDDTRDENNADVPC